MKILVTGGLGYIGSHVAVLLIEQGYEVVLVDNLDNTSLSVLDGITRIAGKSPIFEQLDLRYAEDQQQLFEKHSDIAGIIHFAAHKAVGESVKNPLKYYENNINSLVYLLQNISSKNIPLIFSSSCTVYGEAEEVPIKEDAPLKKAVSPYGNTKQIGEDIIYDVSVANPDFNAILLRYFNPIGAHPSAIIGELPIGVPQNLIPFVTQTVAGKREFLSVFGGDYPTPDGTCIRDYIYIMDLADAHIKSLEFLIAGKNSTNCEVFNLGTGKGSSVLDVITTFEEVNKIPVPYKMAPRRQGDVVAVYADTKKAETVLGWKASFGLKEGLKSAWSWQLNIDKAAASK